MTRAIHDQKTRAPFAERVRLETFDDGGRLAVLTNPHAPTVTIAGTLRAGPAMAGDGRFTVPSLTAMMLDRGAGGLSRMGLARELEDHGLHLDVRASNSSPASVSFTVQGLAEELPRAVRFLSDVLRRPTFPEDEFERVREKVLGILQHERQDTASVAFGGLTREIYPVGHPRRRREVEARENEVRAVTRGDLEAFHHDAYGGGSIVCAVVGNVRSDEVKEMLGEALFGWGAPPRPVPPVPGAVSGRAGRVETGLPDRPNLDVYLGHAGGLHRADEDFAAAQLANACLGHSTLTSRLGVAVRDEAGLTYGISSTFMGTLEIPGPWITNFGVAASDLDRAIDLTRSVIADFVAHGPGERELEDERLAWSGAFRVALATNVGVALEMVRTLSAGQPISMLIKTHGAS